MNMARKRLRKTRLIRHREERYQHAIQKVIDGKAKPNYATSRWHKLQEAKGNGR